MDKTLLDEIKLYLTENLRISIDYFGSSELEITLQLEGEIISQTIHSVPNFAINNSNEDY